MPGRNSFVGSILVGLGVDSRRVVTGTKPATAAVKQHQRGLRQLRGEYHRVRRASRRFVNDFVRNASITLATAFGVARLVSQFLKLDRALVRQRSLVGLSTKETERFRQELIKLAPALGQSPAKLAEGLFFVTSAGFRGSEALEVLRASAQASAIGLGEVEQVATGVTRTVSAYREANLSAAQAAAVLVATVREGNLEASTLIPQFSRLAAITAELGIPVEDLGAAMAALSRTQGPEQAGTALLGVVKPLLKPTQQATDALNRMGLTMADLRRIIEEDGLFQALQMLRRLTARFGVDLGQLFRDQYGIVGLLSLTGANFESVNAIAERMSRTVESDLTRAFQIASESIDFQFNQALSKLEQVGLGVTKQVLPALVKNLSEVVSAIIALVALVPIFKVLRIFGGIFNTITGVARGSKLAVDGLKDSFLSLGKNITAAGAAYGVFKYIQDDVRILLDPGTIEELDRQQIQKALDGLIKIRDERQKIIEDLRAQRRALFQALSIAEAARESNLGGAGGGISRGQIDRQIETIQEALDKNEFELHYATKSAQRAIEDILKFQIQTNRASTQAAQAELIASQKEVFESSSQTYRDQIAQLKSTQRETTRLQGVQDTLSRNTFAYFNRIRNQQVSLLGDPHEIEQNQFIQKQVADYQKEQIRLSRQIQTLDSTRNDILAQRVQIQDRVRAAVAKTEAATNQIDREGFADLEAKAQADLIAFNKEYATTLQSINQQLPVLLQYERELSEGAETLAQDLKALTDEWVRQAQIIDEVTKRTQQQIMVENSRRRGGVDATDFRREQDQSFQQQLKRLEFENSLIGKSNVERQASIAIYQMQQAELSKVTDASLTLAQAEADLAYQNKRLQEAQAAYNALAHSTVPLTQAQQDEMLRLKTALSVVKDEYDRSVPSLQAVIAQQEEIIKVLQELGLTAEEAAERYRQLVAEMQKGEEAQKVADLWEEVGDSIESSLTNAFEQLIIEGKNFGDVMKNLFRQILNELTRLLVIKPLVNSIVGSLGFSTAAEGGYRRGLTLVGELGPELVDFNQPARVYTNDQLQNAVSGGNGQTNIVQNLSFEVGVAQTVRAEVLSLLPQIADASTAATIDRIQRGGVARQAVR